jgi:sRNA-binding carbon storage regulator CsrA
MEIVLGSVGDEFVIEDRIYVTIVAIEGEEVHLAVSTPEFVPVECTGDSA